MFKKNFRLTKNNQFDNVFKKGSSSFNKFFGIKVIKNNLEYNRYGIIVSNKVSKKAVERNRIKRQFREILKEYSKNLKTGFDIVVVVLPASKSLDFVDFKIKTTKQLIKLKLLTNNKG